MSLQIRDLKPEDKAQWLELWAGYLKFYQHQLSEEQTELSWQRLLHAKDGLHGVVAELDGQLVGLAHYFGHPQLGKRTETCISRTFSSRLQFAVVEWVSL